MRVCARFELDAREAGELALGPGDACDLVAHVELHDLDAGACAGVGDVDADVERAVGRRVVDREVVVLERRVREAEAEREQRRARPVDVVAEDRAAAAAGATSWCTGIWPTVRGSEIGSRPDGDATPNSTSAMAAPPCSPGSHA